MDIAINFDDQSFVGTDKVDDVAFEGDLAAESETVKLFAAEGGLEHLLSGC
ncbi:MAG: hypothetical protein R3A46_02870 [Thermomicrobiales bacterium]